MSPKKRIISSATSNIDYDQRVQKTASTLKIDGYDILLIGTGKPSSTKHEFENVTEYIPLFFKRGIPFYVEFNTKLLFRLWRSVRKNDILLANDLDAILPNYLVSRMKGVPLVLDSHELFSEMPSVQGRISQTFWRLLEKYVMPKADKTITVSDSIADWFVKQYEIPRPLVIKNLPFSTNNAVNTNTPENYILYQGALNPSRGLFPLLESMKFIPNDVVLKIAGDGPIRNQLEQRVHDLHLENRVDFLGKVLPNDLKQITQNALLGLSLEEDAGLSYRYSLPNKLFDYIQAQIPVVTTYLPEIKKVTEFYTIGEVIANHEAKEMASKIVKVLENRETYTQGILKASRELVWESQEEALKSVFSSL